MPELQDIFNLYGNEYLENNKVPPHVHKVIRAIQNCRTSALGAHVDFCECGYSKGRWFSIFNEGFVVINAEIHSHISNFSLSMIAYLGIGYVWLLQGVKLRFIVILGTFMIFANFICETLIEFMNTPDIVDAIYGTCGIASVFVFLFFTNKYGLISNNIE